MSQSVVIGIYGESNSGKTKLIEEIIPHLHNQGLSVAVMKKTDKSIDLDTKGKDTWRYRQQGISCVVLNTKHTTTVMIDSSLDTKSIIHLIKEYDEVDVILIEGASDPTLPKIRVGSGPTRTNTFLQYNGNIEDVVAMITNQCVSNRAKHTISIIIDGKEIPVSEFPSEIITNVITSMLSSLKGVEEFQQATITITR